ncbi:trypsin-like serine peptidase [Spirosoma montaniterrae]|uniref:Serine protease n=1 Tax=Spirosoma montaniterrae TaxID=1178516 RepID=A0A1P9WYC0_9BACT|nr:trypsin-like peptidase domain-containing protein [Spirosoma montaniterrae]AQG80370.1 hypothetical protein AWR27_14190 [Spirosoma montaniterrae]
MPPIAVILAALRTPRTAFAELFQQAQVSFPAANRVSFEVVAASPDDSTAFTNALEFAKSNGFLSDLVDELIDGRLADGSLAEAVTQARNDPGGTELQAIVNEVRGFIQPDILFRGLFDGMRWTGKIQIDGNTKGTGVLIGPHLILTAWHVVRPLFRRHQPNGPWQPQPDAASRLQVEFDDYLRFTRFSRAPQNVTPTRVPAHKDWCFTFSSCTDDELDDGFPEDRNQLDNFLDYAILKLKGVPGKERRYASLDANAVVPSNDDTCLLFQYPAAQSLRLDVGPVGSLQPPLQARFLHHVNSLPSSSGGPCFDRSFLLFGLHQGRYSVQNGQKQTNRGIPLLKILRHINENNTNGLPQPDPADDPLWEIDQASQRVPVLNCDAFQSIAWQLAVIGGPKILVIKGPGGIRGIGKTFRANLVLAMLPNGGHLKIVLHAEAIAKMNVEQVVAVICTSAGAPLPDLSKPTDAHSTQTVWLRDKVVPAVMAALNQVRDGKLVWLCLLELNTFKIEVDQTSEFLFMLYEQTLAFDWLRVVLDGMRGDLPDSLRLLVKDYSVPVDLPSDEPIKAYLRRLAANTPQGDLQDIDAVAFVLYDNYEMKKADELEKAMPFLASMTKRLTEKIRGQRV